MLKIALTGAFALTILAGISGAEAKQRCDPPSHWRNGYCVTPMRADPAITARQKRGDIITPYKARGAAGKRAARPRADVQQRKHNYVGHVTLLR